MNVGVLSVQHGEPRRYDDVEIEALQTVTMVLSEMIAAARLVDGAMGRDGSGMATAHSRRQNSAPDHSGSSIPASEVYTEEGILQISPASTNPALTDEGGPNVFRVCGRDDQQGDVDTGCARDHVPDEVLVAGHVHDARADVARQVEPGEAEVDGDAAPLLLGEPIGIGPGERQHERALAVIDVARRADDHVPRHRRSTASVRKSSERSVRPSVTWYAMKRSSSVQYAV